MTLAADPDRGRVWSTRIDEPDYPAALRDTPDPPDILYGIGDLRAVRPGLAVIGSRKATPYGLACARRFSAQAASWGVPINSGGALGCDSAAHQAALDQGGFTVCVLGCGPDVDYPRASGPMLNQIRRTGCVLSEVPSGTEPRRWSFPRRNRIIAGLSRAVLVVEAGLPSGTFSTADHALEAGRDVFAVPGSVHAAGSAGTNRLIRQGAAPISCCEDLYDSLAPLFRLSCPTTAGDPTPAPQDDPLLALLLVEPLSGERLAELADRPLRDVLARLGRLEVEGSVERGADGLYAPTERVLRRGL